MRAKTLTLLGALAVAQGLAPAQPGPVPTQGGGAGFGAAQPGPLGPPRMIPGADVLQPGMGAPVPAPLVAAKFLAPKDVRVTAFPGSAQSRMYDAPAVMGLRPGYVYRFELSNLPYSPGQALYPEVEVRGTLVPRPGMKYMDHPIPLVFSASDIERALKGAVITKVIYLEDPEKALPTEVGANSPVEMTDSTDSDAVKSALANGRLMAIVRLGNLKPTADQLKTYVIEGTILLPGEKLLKSPIAPPQFSYFACPMYDPLLGPKGPKEECFVDGGDKGAPLGIGPNGRLGGLNATDVGVEYTIGGRRKVTTSNEVCICSPRFMIRRAEVLPNGLDHQVRAAANVGAMGAGAIKDRRAPMVDIARTKPAEFEGKVRPSAFVGKVGTAFFINTSRPAAVGQIAGVKIVGVVVEPEQLTAFPRLAPLTVTKSVGPSGPKEAGEVVTITIRYANTGSKAVSDIVVSDSLSGRLEYVEGSSQSDRPSNFTVADNEVGSTVVRWELPGTILPGQSGTVRFKAKVR
ncbi:hypothetical protein VT84_01145 [Gemmata sp. SH-PL17]|uniref:DUF11 domain-containing protein n=1 Tax=Gemmata sp. SH-PL17 TaxID=1630693 RepID=UPI00078CA980|nr:DUF11 domain-containing protein [Gemmata sp. SH-PL17]AMV22985.1 hypothetical protein VT84_01145 [Gemmata sp. SH-PL17]